MSNIEFDYILVFKTNWIMAQALSFISKIATNIGVKKEYL